MNLTQDQKNKLKEIIEGDAYNYFNDIVVAKEEIANIAKSVKEEFGVEKRDFNKMLKLFAGAIAEEEREKELTFWDQYDMIFNING